MLIPYNRPSTDQDEIRAVTEVLQGVMLTQGECVPRFEEALKEYCGVRHATAVSSGTAALHLACLSLEISEEHAVWTVSNSFLASANCAEYCGAEIDFIDINPDTGQFCIESLSVKLESAEKSGILPHTVIVVDYSGDCGDLAGLRKLADRYGFFIIQDASHSFGADFHKSEQGSCRFSDITTFSFHPIKTITTAEGGALLTNNEQIDERIRSLRSHGIDTNTVKEYPWSYQQSILGFNYRMSDVHAALGLSQIKKADDFVIKRRHILSQYNKILGNTVGVIGSNQSSCHLVPVLLPETADLSYISGLVSFFREKEILLQKHYIPIHTQPYYRTKKEYSDLYGTMKFYNRQISLPCYTELSDQDITRVCNTLIEYGL